MTKTNAGLVEYCQAQLGRPYWYGTFGQKASAALYADKKKQYPKYYTAKDFQSQYGKRVHDCAGLIKGYLWSDTPTSTPKYDPKTDYGATGFYQHCSKKGSLDTFDHVPGRLMFKGKPTKMTHVGVYIGDGWIVEAKGHAYGVIKSKLDTKWTHWGQCNLIEEDQTAPASQPEPAPKPTTTTYQVKTNGNVLRLREKPTTVSKCLAKIPNKTRIEVSEIVKGSTVLGNNKWAKTTYKGKTGYCSMKYLQKI